MSGLTDFSIARINSRKKCHDLNPKPQQLIKADDCVSRLPGLLLQKPMPSNPIISMKGNAE